MNPAGAEDLLKSCAGGGISCPQSGSCCTVQVSTSTTGESPCVQFQPAHAVLSNSWPNLNAPLTLGHRDQGATAACAGDSCTNREHCHQSTMASAFFPSMGSGPFPLLTWPTCMAESRELPLYNINLVHPPFLGTKMPLSNWLATSNLSLVPGQGGQALTVLWRDNYFSDSPDKQGSLTVVHLPPIPQPLSVLAFQLPQSSHQQLQWHPIDNVGPHLWVSRLLRGGHEGQFVMQSQR